MSFHHFAFLYGEVGKFMPSVLHLSVLTFLVLFGSLPSYAYGTNGDPWDWYKGMTPFEQCQDYLSGDPYIEEVTGDDFTDCDFFWPDQD